jgi:hypothetical protein
LKTVLAAYIINPESSIEVYYKVNNSVLQSDFDDIGWTPYNVYGESDSGNPSSGGFGFVEYAYTIDDTEQFDSFAIKIVMKAGNPAYPPLVKDFRAIAVA